MLKFYTLILLSCCVLMAKEVKVSDFGFDAADSTRFLQAAIDSGAERVIVDDCGKPWITTGLKLRGDLELVLTKNVRIEAKRGAFIGKNDCLLLAEGARNIIIRGESGAELLMHKSDYMDKSKYEFSEWRHNIAIWNCHNVTIRDLKITGSGGDGIYVSTRRIPENYCSNITIDNVILNDHYRQGISVISVENFLLRNSVVKGTGGTAPQAGIDFEPNFPNERLVNVRIEDTIFEDNQGGGIMLATPCRTPLSMTVDRVTVRGGNRGLVFYRLRNVKTTGSVKFTDCKLEDINNDAIFIRDHSAADCYDIEIRDTTVSHRNASAGPLSFIVTQPFAKVFGNLQLDNLTIQGYENSAPIVLKSWQPGSSLAKVTGNLSFNGKKIDVAEFIKTSGLDQPVPVPQIVGEAETFARLGVPKGKRQTIASPGLRGDFQLLFYADAGEELDFKLNLQKFGRAKPVNLSMHGPENYRHDLGLVPFGESEYRIKVPAAGLYRLPVTAGAAALRITPGKQLRWAIMNPTESGAYLNLFRIGKMRMGYFEVPQGVREFKIEFAGDPGETLDLEIRDASGKIVAAKNNFDEPTVFTFTRDRDEVELWSFLLKRATEDVKIRFHAPLLPVWADSPGNLPRQ